MNSAIIWVALVFVGFFAVLLLRKRESRRLIRGRKPQELEMIYASTMRDIDAATFREVLTAIGSSFSMDPRLIRPADSLESLYRMDSWSLGSGTEALNDWLRSQGLEVLSKNPSTVLDLAREVQAARRR